MPFCDTCYGVGRLKQSVLCPDCDGRGQVTEKHKKFIEYYREYKSGIKQNENADKVHDALKMIQKFSAINNLTTTKEELSK